MTDLTTTTDTLRDAPLGDLLEADLPTRIAALEALSDAIAAGDLQDEREAHTGTELGQASVRVHQTCTRLTGKRYQWLAVEETDGLWATSAFHPRTYASHVARTHGISYRSARDSVRLARQLRDAIPQFGQALRAGTIGGDHVHAFATTALTSPTRIAALEEQVELSDEQADGQPEDQLEDEPEAHDEPGPHDEAQSRSVSVETFLLTQAQDLRPDQVRRLGKHFAHVADPEADERGYTRTKEREYLELARTLDGWHLSGFLTEEHGRLVRAAIDALTTPPTPDDQRTPDQRRAQALADVAHLVLDQGLAGTRASVRPHLGVLISPTDFQRLLREAATTRSNPRTTNQPTTSSEQHHNNCPTTGPTSTDTPSGAPSTTGSTDAEHAAGPPAPDADLERHRPSDPDPAIAADPGGADDPPDPQAPAPPGQRTRTDDWDPATLTDLAQIDWATRLTENPPTFDDGTGPVPPALLRRLAGCGDVYRTLFSPDSEVINHGRTHRLFTPAQRRALIARDKGCTWPGCTAPPALCESHHARIHWADGGNTNLTNGALLCFHHHDLVDARSITMTRHNGTWTFTRPDGTTINTDIHPPAEQLSVSGSGEPR